MRRVVPIENNKSAGGFKPHVYIYLCCVHTKYTQKLRPKKNFSNAGKSEA